MSSTNASTLTVLSEAEFDARFPLLVNHLDANASLDGVMFETFDEELAFVLRQPLPHRPISMSRTTRRNCTTGASIPT